MIYGTRVWWPKGPLPRLWMNLANDSRPTMNISRFTSDAICMLFMHILFTGQPLTYQQGSLGIAPSPLPPPFCYHSSPGNDLQHLWLEALGLGSARSRPRPGISVYPYWCKSASIWVRSNSASKQRTDLNVSSWWGFQEGSETFSTFRCKNYFLKRSNRAATRGGSFPKLRAFEMTDEPTSPDACSSCSKVQTVSGSAKYGARSLA